MDLTKLKGIDKNTNSVSLTVFEITFFTFLCTQFIKLLFKNIYYFL